ncbi:MAG: hypothetical protein ABSA26_02615 [Thermoguttaceae bacterium]
MAGRFFIAGFDAALDFKPPMGSDWSGAQFLLVEEGIYENGAGKAHGCKTAI